MIINYLQVVPNKYDHFESKVASGASARYINDIFITGGVLSEL